MAEFSSSALLLDGGAKRRGPEGGRGTACLATVNQRATAPARRVARRKTCQAKRAKSGPYRSGPPSAELRRRDLLGRARIDECGQATPRETGVARKHWRHRCAFETDHVRDSEGGVSSD